MFSSVVEATQPGRSKDNVSPVHTPTLTYHEAISLP